MNGKCLFGVKALFPSFNKQEMFVRGKPSVYHLINGKLFVGGKGVGSIF